MTYDIIPSSTPSLILQEPNKGLGVKIKFYIFLLSTHISNIHMSRSIKKKSHGSFYSVATCTFSLALPMTEATSTLALSTAAGHCSRQSTNPRVSPSQDPAPHHCGPPWFPGVAPLLCSYRTMWRAAFSLPHQR